MRFFWIALALVSLPNGAMANDAPSALSVELNKVEDASDGCQLTFLASNGHAKGITQLVFETVLFDKQGSVNRLTLFDFGAIPTGVPRVRQFVIPALACTDLGRILINGVSTCQAPGLDEAACSNGMNVTSRIEVELVG